jgi:uncharacterized protein YndB with AHSA1/START domain
MPPNTTPGGDTTTEPLQTHRGEVVMERKIVKTATVTASLDDVWDVWTTKAGLQSFFAPRAEIEMWPNRPFEIHFFPENPPGQRGAEGLCVLSFLPKKMLSFEWNAPPHFPEVRAHGNWVVVEFEGRGDRVKVTLHHLGWKDSEQWTGTYDYFQSAWDVVIGRFKQRMSDGPIDWDALT